MPRTIEIIITGVRLQGRVVFDPECTTLEKSVIAWGLRRIKRLGGLCAEGFGAVDVVVEGEDHDGDVDDGQAFEAWLEAATREVEGEFLLNLFRELGPVKHKANKAKKGKGKKKAETPGESTEEVPEGGAETVTAQASPVQASPAPKKRGRPRTKGIESTIVAEGSDA